MNTLGLSWVIEAIGSTPSFRVDVWFGPDASRKSWGGTGRSAHIRVKYPCKACNNGWMSDLETAAQPVIRPFMNDISVPLDRWQQHLIALWAIKTAMVFECTVPVRERFYSQADRDHLLTAFAPPAGTSMWVAGVSGAISPLFRPCACSGPYLKPMRRLKTATSSRSRLPVWRFKF